MTPTAPIQRHHLSDAEQLLDSLRRTIARQAVEIAELRAAYEMASTKLADATNDDEDPDAG